MKKLFITFLFMSFSVMLLAQDSLNMRLNYNWFDTTLPYNNYWASDGQNMRQYFNEIWGWHNPADDREYAIIGAFDGTFIFDVTDPDNTVMADYIPAVDRADIHRDYKTHGNYLYGVADEGNNNLQIIDLSYLPDSAHIVYNSNAFVVQSHNIYIDEGILYMVSPKTGSGTVTGLRMLDLNTDPENPTLLADFNLPPGHGSHIHDLYVRNKVAYCSNGTSGFFIYDVSDPNNVVLLNSITAYTDQGYNHNSWLSEDGNTLFFADETHGMGIKAYDISDINNLTELTVFRSNVGAIPHNILVHGDSLYAAYYHDGVYVFNIENPACPYVVAHYDTYQEPDGYYSYQGAWGVYPFLPSGTVLASDFENGLFVLTIDSMTGVALPDCIDANVEELNKKLKISIVPNPSNGQVTLSLPSAHGQLKIYGVDGRLVYKQNVNQEEINLNVEHWNEGIYNVVYLNNGELHQQKFVRQ